MKKNLLTLVAIFSVVILASSQTFGQETADAQQVKGVNYLNAGIGLGTFGFTGTGGLPITASFEHGFTDKISAGISLGMVSTKYATYWKYNYFVIGARGSYHFNELLNVTNPKLDVYGGATLFYRGYSIKYDGPGDPGKSSAGGLDFAIHAGGRYYFSSNVGAFAELGYGISPLQLGVTFRF